MPYTVTIPIVGNTDCTNAMIVDYKKSTETQWTRLDPAPIGDTIVLNNLSDNTTYNIRGVKQCCNGQYSTQTLINVTTGS